MSLSRSAEEWADEAIFLYMGNKGSREQASQSVYDQGYDSKLVARQLEQLYTEKVKR